MKTVPIRFKLDPRTKIWLLLVVSISIMAGESGNRHALLKLLLVAVPIVLLLTEKRYKGAIGFAVLYVSVSQVQVLFSNISTSSMIGVILRLLMGFIGGMGPCIIMGYYLVTTTRVSEFIAAMERMHISKNIVIPFTVMFRFFPTIREEYGAINEAMKMRGLKYRYNPVAMLEYRLVPLIISTVKIGNELSAAALTRGLGSKVKRTNVCQIGFGISDIVLVIFTTIVAVLYVVV